jgi:hypothetical protein
MGKQNKLLLFGCVGDQKLIRKEINYGYISNANRIRYA